MTEAFRIRSEQRPHSANFYIPKFRQMYVRGDFVVLSARYLRNVNYPDNEHQRVVVFRPNRPGGSWFHVVRTTFPLASSCTNTHMSRQQYSQITTGAARLPYGNLLLSVPVWNCNMPGRSREAFCKLFRVYAANGTSSELRGMGAFNCGQLSNPMWYSMGPFRPEGNLYSSGDLVYFETRQSTGDENINSRGSDKYGIRSYHVGTGQFTFHEASGFSRHLRPTSFTTTHQGVYFLAEEGHTRRPYRIHPESGKVVKVELSPRGLGFGADLMRGQPGTEGYKTYVSRPWLTVLSYSSATRKLTGCRRVHSDIRSFTSQSSATSDVPVVIDINSTRYDNTVPVVYQDPGGNQRFCHEKYFATTTDGTTIIGGDDNFHGFELFQLPPVSPPL